MLRSLGIAVVLTSLASSAWCADEVSTATMSIKDGGPIEKRKIRMESVDPTIVLTGVDSPDLKGAAVHVYSSDYTDRLCRIVPQGDDWSFRKGRWKYKNRNTKTAVSVKDGRLSVAIGTGVTYSLADEANQGSVNAVVQFGEGTRYCMRCPGNKRDDTSAFKASKCAPAPCTSEWIPCRPVAYGPHVCVPGNVTDLSDDGCACTSNVECRGVCPVGSPRFCAGGNTGPLCAAGNTFDMSADGCPCTGNNECVGVCPVSPPPGSAFRRCAGGSDG